MESEQRIDLLLPLRVVAQTLGRIAALGTRTEMCLSEHKRGAAEMLDQHLDAPQLPFPVDRSRN